LNFATLLKLMKRLFL